MFADRVRRLVALLVEHFRQRLAAKQRPAGQQCIHQRTKTVEIRPHIDGLTGGLLGRHVFGRAEDVAGAGQPRIAEQPRDAEVRELHAAVGRQQQIARLDVAMDHAAVVGVAQCGQVSTPIRVTSRQSKRRPRRNSSSRLFPSTSSIT